MNLRARPNGRGYVQKWPPAYAGANASPSRAHSILQVAEPGTALYHPGLRPARPGPDATILCPVFAMPSTASRLNVFTESVIRGMTRLANRHGAINLAQGFPDFD